MFQFYNLIPSLTARENVTLVTDIVEHPMTAEQALWMVGLGETTCSSELSQHWAIPGEWGGEQPLESRQTWFVDGSYIEAQPGHPCAPTRAKSY